MIYLHLHILTICIVPREIILTHRKFHQRPQMCELYLDFIIISFSISGNHGFLLVTILL